VNVVFEARGVAGKVPVICACAEAATAATARTRENITSGGGWLVGVEEKDVSWDKSLVLYATCHVYF
jgi:hypothetical protein